jgi:hypothetical protein
VSNQPTNVTIEHPISQALTYTKRIFSPFDASKWLGLAFCAFLANCSKGGGGGGGGGNFLNSLDSPTGGSRPGSGSVAGGLGDLSSFYQDNLEPALGILLGLGGVVIAAIILAIVAMAMVIRVLTLWIGSRGDFMFMDGILHNRGNVIEPWGRFAGLAHSLFLTRVIVDLLMWLCLGLSGALIAYGAVSMSTAPAQGGLILIFACFCLLVPGLIAVSMIHFIINTFVLPAMYKSKTPASQVWPMVKSEVISGHWGDIFLYGLVRIGLHIGVGIATIVITVCTCCLPVIPYIGTVVLLPFITFMRSHQLSFYEELTGSPMVDTDTATLLT